MKRGENKDEGKSRKVRRLEKAKERRVRERKSKRTESNRGETMRKEKEN